MNFLFLYCLFQLTKAKSQNKCSGVHFRVVHAQPELRSPVDNSNRSATAQQTVSQYTTVDASIELVKSNAHTEAVKTLNKSCSECSG